MSILRVEPFSGVSGDLFVGALAQLVDGEALLNELPKRLGFKSVKTIWETVNKCGVSCRKVMFVDETGEDSHSHRHLSHIVAMIEGADLAESVQTRAIDIFTLLGEAEASTHGVSLKSVHFHEVGAVDSIMDIVGAALLLDQMNIEKVYCDPVVTGKGFVQMAHGRYPIPAPATHQLLAGMVTDPGDVTAELTTPTGAAILRHLQPSFDLPQLRLLKSGIAGATKDFEHPNILRLSLCEAVEQRADLLLLQSNIDDMPAEYLGSDILQMLLDGGAKDAWISPIVMKEGRSAYKLEAICESQAEDSVTDLILENTTSIGVRVLPIARKELARESVLIKTKLGEIRGKKVLLPSGKSRVKPEYQDCVRLGKEAGRPAYDIYKEAFNASACL